MPSSRRAPKRAVTAPPSTRRHGKVSPRVRAEHPVAAGAGGLSGPGSFSGFVYNGGPVINTPQVHIMFVGDWSSTANQNRATRLAQFVGDMLSSRYMNILSQYGCGTSGAVTSTTIVAAPSASLSGTDLHTLIQTAIGNGQIPEPTDQASCVLIYLDDATAVDDTTAGVRMCEATSDDAFGYHDHFVTTAGNTYPFAVVPGLTNGCLQNSCPGGDASCSLKLTQTQEQRQTQVTSHELSEMFSNPHVGADEAWSEPSGPHENGDICNGESATITVGANTWTVQEMYSKFDDMNSNGATTCVTESDPLPSLLPACTIALDRSTFGSDEVDALIHAAGGGTAHVEAAFYVAIDGFTPADLNITTASFTHPPDIVSISPTVSGMSVEPTALVVDDPTLSGAIQRFTWVYRVNFTSSAGFPTSEGDERDVTLQASVSRSGTPAVSASGAAVLRVVHEPNPYEVDGSVSWLSTDLRVFQIAAGASKFGATMGSDAPGFIQAVIANLNAGNTEGQTFDNDLSTDENASALELAQSVGGTAVFNFALARVRYRSLAADIANVRVFFRAFPVATTSTTYDRTTAYRRGGQAGTTIPLLGISGGEITTIPFFASPRIDATSVSMNAQTDAPNVQPIAHDPSGNESVVYFGAWLDINQPGPRFPLNPAPTEGPFSPGSLQSIQQLVRGAHQCLISEIAFDAAPIPSGSTAGSSDKLAQRNLAIVGSANPGDIASHTVSHPFELARSAPASGAAPNELLIDFRALPAASAATLYIPGTSADAVKRVADARYVSHRLTVVDAHTLGCPASGIAFVPLPAGTGPRLPGLLTVELPDGIRHGEAFQVVVRELHDATAKRPAGGPPGRGPGAESRRLLRWRQVAGSYQLSIPVKTKDVLLAPEERLYGVLLWILQAIPNSNRWHPVFTRYTGQVGDRVRALGGDPGEIKPSPGGPPEGHHQLGGHGGHTGKVCEVVFDCRGDLEGFVVESCEARWAFRSREPGVAELALRAARDRLTVTVTAAAGDEIERIIVRGG